MKAVEFTTELTGAATLQLPADVAAQLPKAGKARVIVMTDGPTADVEWQRAGYEHFVREDPPEDAAYDSLR